MVLSEIDRETCSNSETQALPDWLCKFRCFRGHPKSSRLKVLNENSNELLFLPSKFLKGSVDRGFGNVVDVVAHHFLRKDEDDVENVTGVIAGGIKSFLLLGGETTAAAHDGESGVLESLQFFVGHGATAAKSFRDRGVHFHGVGDVGMRGDAVVALMFDVDGLPNDGELLGIESGRLRELVQNLVAFEQSGGLGHDGVEIGDHAEALD